VQAHPYVVSVYGSSSGFELVPGASVRNAEYRPSKGVEVQIAAMWNHRQPSLIGSVSEQMAMEILDCAQIKTDSGIWALTCEKLRNVSAICGNWRPERGIYCDDLITTAVCSGQKMMFLTEVKGTTRKGGLSRWMEAKMFYQLARTYVTIIKRIPAGPPYPIMGVITIAITHSWKTITINVLNEAAAKGFFPDGWLPPEEGY
jgi:hypothetical protein